MSEEISSFLPFYRVFLFLFFACNTGFSLYCLGWPQALASVVSGLQVRSTVAVFGQSEYSQQG